MIYLHLFSGAASKILALQYLQAGDNILTAWQNLLGVHTKAVAFHLNGLPSSSLIYESTVALHYLKKRNQGPGEQMKKNSRDKTVGGE